MDAEVGVVFLPCGHLVVCVNCAPNLKVKIQRKKNKCLKEIFYRLVPFVDQILKALFELFSPEHPSCVKSNPACGTILAESAT